MLDIKKAVRAAIESDKARITLCSSASVAALYALTSASPVMAAGAAASATLQGLARTTAGMSSFTMR